MNHTSGQQQSPFFLGQFHYFKSKNGFYYLKSCKNKLLLQSSVYDHWKGLVKLHICNPVGSVT